MVTAIQSDTAMHMLFRSLLGHTSLKDASWETAHGCPWSTSQPLGAAPAPGPGGRAEGEPTHYLCPAACKSHLPP